VADKPKTPAPPRKVQAPKVRSSREPRTGGGNKRIWIAVGAAVVVLAAIGGGLALAMTSGGGTQAAGGGAGDVCDVQTFPGLAADHVTSAAELPKGFKYNSYPPSSGPHYPDPLIFGEYSDALEQNRLLHNLEHGGVGVQYGPDVPDETVAALTAWYRSDPRGIILAPLPSDPRAAKYADAIVLTAWVADRDDPTDPNEEPKKQTGVLANCSTFDEGTFDSFLAANRGHGPELFTLDQLAPGF
jgi:hypothetical protein